MSMEQKISFMAKVRPKLRAAVFSQPVNLKEKFDAPVYPKTEGQLEFLNKYLTRNFIYEDLSPKEQNIFIDAMQHEKFDEGAFVITEGDIGDYFYLIESGHIEYVKGTKAVGKAGKGECFGELALLYDSPRAVSCVATSTVSVWKLDQKTFRMLIAKHAHEHDSSLKDLIRKINIFKNLDESTVTRFISSMTPVHWKAGDRIVQKGEEGNIFYIVETGKIKVHDIGLGDSSYEDMELSTGAYFGERALLTGEPRAANVTAMTDATTMAMDRATFEKTIGPLKELMEHEMKKTSLKGLPMFAKSQITEPEIDRISDLMTEVCYSKGTVLAEAGKKHQMALWIVRHGQILVTEPKTGKTYSLKAGDYFGDEFVRGDPEKISALNAVTEVELTAWSVTREEIENVVGDIDRLGLPVELVSQKDSKRILLEDLNKRKILGQGAFGKVWLVNVKESDDAYALKAINKRRLLESNQAESVIREKEMLSLLSHPFILHLVSSFQDESNLYLLLPLVPGGELFSVLHRKKHKGRGLDEKMAAFYASCVIEALGHFHQRLIAYRDLKLENVLIDEKGYCVICDLGFAKIVDDKTYTLVGTPEYLAPEIIMSKGHDKAVDYWSFGVLCYELMCGTSPFFDEKASQVDMFKKIVLVKFTFPDYVDGSAKSFVKKLLVRRTANRLGNLARGYLDVKAHPWFDDNGIKFKNIMKRKSKAPWVPKIKNSMDASNFDDFSDLETEEEHGPRLNREEQQIFRGF